MLNLRTSENRDNTERPRVVGGFCYLGDKTGAKELQLTVLQQNDVMDGVIYDIT